MASDPRDRLDNRRAHLEEIGTETGRRLLELSKALDDKFPTVVFRDEDNREQTFAPRSIDDYMGSLLKLGRENGIDVLDVDAETINSRMREIKENEGLVGSTIAGYQSALIAFYRFHNDIGVDPDHIDVDSEPSNVRYDEQDLFTSEEVWALREACVGSWASRDRALLELLIYTGQRITALLTLRASDVDLDDDAIYLNDDFDAEHGGLKGALDRGRRRRLLGAKKYVRDWLEYRPGDTDWLFMGDPENPNTAQGDHWSASAASERLEKIADRAGVDKPVKPHAFRHYTATTLYRDWDWDEAQIKAQLGLSRTSAIFETTYSHITDSELIDEGARQFHGTDGDSEDEETMTPPTCPTCAEVLKPHWTECPNPSCSERFGETGEEVLVEELEGELGKLAMENPGLAKEAIDAMKQIRTASGD